MHYQLKCFCSPWRNAGVEREALPGAAWPLLCVSGGASESQHMSIWIWGETDRDCSVLPSQERCTDKWKWSRARWRCSNLVLSQMVHAGAPSQAIQCFLSLPRTMKQAAREDDRFFAILSRTIAKVGKEKLTNDILFNITFFSRQKWN